MKIKLFLIIFLFFNNVNLLFASDDFFKEGLIKYNEKKYDESKFLFQRSIVFNPKESKSYLFLAKIFNHEENKREAEKNIETVLLLNPQNEEAIYMLMEIELVKSNYSRVRELNENFEKVCTKLCEKKFFILDSLKNLEPKNES
tara:strand:- start:344 stop:775 length:432 start_codon:yes stop_codon:yes gene_type:complete